MQSKNQRNLFFVCLSLLVVFNTLSNVMAGDLDITQCDTLAAHPDDPKKFTEGVAWDRLDAMAALDACALEINRQPLNARIQYQYARVLDKQELYNEAFAWYQKAAQNGYAAAQNSLGYAYEWGQGIEMNMQDALRWYRQAAKQGYAQAQNNLGTMYDYGKGVDDDEKQATYWYQKAAEQGNSTAQRNLGLMYSKGSGVKQNDETAFQWYLKAADQENPHAQYNVGMSYFYGKGVESDQKKARVWFKKAAKNGNYQAVEALSQIQFKQAYCHSQKKGSGNRNSQSNSVAIRKLSVGEICP